MIRVSWWAGQLVSFMWEVKFPKRWYGIDDSAQQQITAAWQSGSPTVQFCVCKSERKALWNSYSIEFRTMEQTNIESGRIREVRLTTTPVGIEDAPGGKRMKVASSSNEGGVAAGPGVEDEVEGDSLRLEFRAAMMDECKRILNKRIEERKQADSQRVQKVNNDLEEQKEASGTSWYKKASIHNKISVTRERSTEHANATEHGTEHANATSSSGL